MISPGHHLLGGVASTAIAVLGTVLNILVLLVLCSDKKLRSNSTTILIIFMTFSNLLFTGLVLPVNSIALLHPQFVRERPLCCKTFALFFYWNFAVLLFTEAALAINRWATVCTVSCRWASLKKKKLYLKIVQI